MLATFIIGLREGLEAALIVSIIAAFLRRNGRSLGAMWAGVVLAVILSIAVGITLKVVERALPQAEQEGMEVVIGLVAVVFVTSMIAWMNRHAHEMRHAIETDTAAALGQASTFALAAMAFLAVLKEGFETSVFLLATLAAAHSAPLALTGAVLGIVLAVAIGWGLYAGAIRFDLGRFFSLTGGFLVLVAAGLIVSALRSAHEAGWLDVGQTRVADLSWLVRPGTIRAALIGGVMGIPADPRRVEIFGWFAYLIAAGLALHWPRAWQLSRRARVRLELSAAALGAVLAAVLAWALPTDAAPVDFGPAPLVAADASGRTMGTATWVPGNSAAIYGILKLDVDGGSLSLPLPRTSARAEERQGLAVHSWQLDESRTPPHRPGKPDRPDVLTWQQVFELNGRRRPVGLNPQLHPGPFRVQWREHQRVDVTLAQGSLLDASGRSLTVMQLSGSDLMTPRTLRVARDAADTGWQVAPGYRARVMAALRAAADRRRMQVFWNRQLPLMLGVVALVCAGFGLRHLTRKAAREPRQQKT